MKKKWAKFTSYLFSGKATLLLLGIFGATIGIATFIENSYDTFTAQKIIYKAKWFEVLILLLIINFLGVIKKRQLLKKEKIPSLCIHLAFIIIIIGAAITRYFGWIGDMHIREGSQTDTVYVAETSLQLRIQEHEKIYKKTLPLLISQLGNNHFSLQFETTTKNKIEVSYKNYIQNFKTVQKNFLNSPSNILELEILAGTETLNRRLENGSYIEVNGVKIAFNKPEETNAIHFYPEGKNYFVSAPYDLIGTLRTDGNGLIKADSIIPVEINNVFNTQKGVVFQVKNIENSSSISNSRSRKNEKWLDALVLNVQIEDQHYEAVVLGGDDYIAKDTVYVFDGLKFSLAYGFRPHKLPFSLYLNDFILERYPGSKIPSYHQSNLTLIDSVNEINEDKIVAMNKILDYRGYRFFQMSYDEDEKGTILSVNYDFYGTLVSYLGYFLLILGVVLLPFSKKSRFFELPKKIKELRDQRKSLS